MVIMTSAFYEQEAPETQKRMCTQAVRDYDYTCLRSKRQEVTPESLK